MPSIAELLLAQGQQAAATRERLGQIWGNALTNVGQQVGAIPGQIAQGRAFEQQTKLQGLQLDQAQREAASVKAFESAMSDPSNYKPDGSIDEDKIGSSLRQSNIGAYEHYIDLSTKQAQAKLNYAKTLQEIQGSQQTLEDKQRAAAAAQQEQLGRYAYAGQQMIAQKPDDLVHARDTTLALAAHAVGDRLVNPDQAKQFIAQTAQASPDQLSQVFGSFVPPDLKAKFESEAATTAKSRAEAEKASAEAAKARAQAMPPDMTKYQAQIDAIVPPTDQANAGLRSITMSRVKNARTVEDADKAIDEASKQMGQINVAARTVPYKIQVQQGGANYDATGEDGSVSPTVKAIAEYRQAPPPIGRAGTRALMDAVNKYNPAYDATLFPQRQRVRNAYTTGTEGQQLNALNTAIMHMDLLADAADALKNGTFKPGNAVYNKVVDMFGSAEPNSYETIKEFLDGEVGSVVKKGAATEGEMGRLEAKGGASSSPEQLRAYIQNAMHIMGGKAVVLNDKYHSVMGEKDPFTAISDRSADVLTKHGFKPAEFGGKAAAVPSNVSAALKGQAPGIHTLSDGSRWMVGADGTVTKQ